MRNLLFIIIFTGILIVGGCKGPEDNNGAGKNYPAEIPASEKIDVVAWLGVRAAYATEERFKEAADMGITINFSRFGNVETALKALDEAGKANVKLIVDCDELRSDEERGDAIRKLMGHPALYGYHIKDEPHPIEYAELARVMTEIQQIDKDHICYCNLLPNGQPEHYAALGVKDYQEYVDRYLNECPATFLSFDKYPVIIQNGSRAVQPDWYEALEVISASAKKADMDFWSFLLTVPHGAYPQPTADDLRLQAYVNLAYGTQVLQCFTYWNPDNNPTLNYRNAPIALDGTRTETYDIAKSVLEKVQQLSWVFKGNNVTGVYHLGDPLPKGTKAPASLPSEITELSLGRSTNTACVSFFENHGYNFMMIVNTDINDRCTVKVATQPHVRRILKNNSVAPASNDDRTMTINPGDMLLYMW